MSCATAQSVYTFPRQRGSVRDHSLAAGTRRPSTSNISDMDAAADGRTASFYPLKRTTSQGRRPLPELSFSALHDREREETSFLHFRGPRLGWRFLMVQAVFFLINLCVCQPIPTITAAGVWRFVTSPPRMLYRGLKWLRGEGQRFSAEGFPLKVRKARQQRRERNVAKAKELKDLAMEKVKECDSKGAVKLFQQAARLDSTDAEIPLRMSKSLSDRVFEPELWGSWRAKRLAAKAVRISKKVLQKNPDVCLAHVCHATNLGRLSMFSENREKVQLASEIRERAEAALEINPNDDLAHHVLGRWEFEMASLGPMVRALAKMLFGDMGQGDFERAKRCFEKASELSPYRLIHHVMLAKVCLKVGDKKHALEHLQRAMKLPVDDMCASCERKDGVELLKKNWNITAPKPPPLGQPFEPLEQPSLVARISTVSTTLLSEAKRCGSKDALLSSCEKALNGLAHSKPVGQVLQSCESHIHAISSSCESRIQAISSSCESHIQAISTTYESHLQAISSSLLPRRAAQRSSVEITQPTPIPCN
uniref:Regulator of microtubule dynamics protein 1 n=1 Tax=Pyramimonas obovata TaxID=1411642 RepID=A0A7S0N3N6_9CHLO|mmetsp:Transcript_18235/g.39871  ORF Transcript_18235/g.39871 Transcript_18235/m.39871 type:complete len:536 (+) Transcript_18235:182-1789(+)